MRLWAEISRGRFLENIKTIRNYVKPAEVLFVVKANAYGHGVGNAVKLAKEAEIRWLGVTSASEAAVVLESLNEIDYKPNILCFFEPEDKEEIEYLISKGISFNLFTKSLIEKVETVSKKLNLPAKVHLKINTGMNRLGASKKEAIEIAEKVLSSKSFQLEGIWSHLATAEEPGSEFVSYQIKQFEEVAKSITANKRVLLHLANTGGALFYPESRFDMVRVGIGAYGYFPSFKSSFVQGLKPIMKVKAKITAVRKLSSGEGVSYGLKWKAKEPTWIAVVAVGYADGLPYCASGKLKFLYKGKLFDQIGSICMDQCIVNFLDIVPEVGETVEIISDEFDASQIAQVSNTITYEVLVKIGERVERILVD